MPTLMIIVASTRPGRAGGPVSEWLGQRAGAHGAFAVDVADLAEIDLPMLDEPHHPRLQDYQHDHTRAWSERVAGADAVVVVTPEYNHSYPAPLKNAIDYLHVEWRGKPVGLVTYGGVSGGTRAMVALEPVLLAVGMVPSQLAVNVPFVAKAISDGRFAPNEVTEQAADALLDDLARLHDPLADLRA